MTASSLVSGLSLNTRTLTSRLLIGLMVVVRMPCLRTKDSLLLVINFEMSMPLVSVMYTTFLLSGHAWTLVNWFALMLSLRKSLLISSSFKKHPLPSSFSSLTSNELVLLRLDMLSEAIDDHDLVDADGGGPLGPGDFRPGDPAPPTPAIVACSSLHKLCICNTRFLF